MILSIDAPSVEQATEDEAREWLKGYNADMQNIMSTAAAASWAYNTNLTKHNQNLSVSTDDDMRLLYFRLSAPNACLPKTEISVFVTERVFCTSTCYKLHMFTLDDVLYS